MKKQFLFILLVIVSSQIFAQSINSTVVPWTTGLRIREAPAVSSKAIAYLGLWEKLTVIEIKEGTEVINGNEGCWVKVKRENRQVLGWCFSYFLDEIDENNFFPVLEYRGLAHALSRSGYGSREIYTLYNDGKRRERFILFWNNKRIDIFDNLFVSDNGKIIAFNWLDTSTIKRNSREGTLSGNRYLFVYNFANHRLVKIDDKLITESDQFSDRWEDKWDLNHGFVADGFYFDRNIEYFILNSNGTKLFYITENVGIEMDLTTGNKVNHQIDTEVYLIEKYVGNFILLSRNDDDLGLKNFLYNPAEKKILSNLEFYNNVRFPNSDLYRYYPVAISKNRYLVIEQDDARKENYYEGLVIYDLVTNQEKKYTITGRYTRYFQEDCFYIVTFNNNKTIYIKKFDYNNNILAQYKYNEISQKLGSFTFTSNNAGIVVLYSQNHRRRVVSVTRKP